MCGLAGFRRRDGRPADASLAARMLDRQRHRGPDHRGTWATGDTALGLDRLAILDLTPHGDQPYVMPDGSGALAYNGEVYNWRALREELVREGVTFVSHCDTEVVMHALHRWGPERAVPRLNGMFAFAWRDLRDDTLWLGRDRTGIKPLYLAETAAVVAFASESKALFAHPDIPCRPDVHALVTNVWFERLVPPWTAFEGVRQVVPGTLLRFSGSTREEITWFDLERDLDVGRIVAAAAVPFREQVARFRARIEESVALHLQSDAPLAVMCSGGLDSSLTTAIAARHQPDLVAYVAEAEGLRESEADKAQQVADHLGVRLRRIPIRIAEFPGLWVRAAWHNDDPIFFNQNPLALKVCEAVRDDGVKVLVTGEGSDELFGGYGWQAEAARMWRMRDWHRRLLPDVAPLRRLGRWLQWLAPFDLKRLGEDPFARRATLDRMPTFAPLVLDAGMRKHRAATLFARLAPVRPVADRAFLAREFDDVYHHLRVLLNANDKMSMAASVEARVPFLENGVIDFGLHLDRKSKWDRGQSKRVVKAAASDLLPADIIHARKVGFGVPDQMFTGYEGILEGGIIAELFKWGPREREQRAQLLRDKQWRAGQIVGMELWAQMHFNGASQEQLTERLRAARRA